MEEKYSDFIKKAYELGRVKDLEEAFNEYPTSEEWHKGDIKNVINEESIQYASTYTIGDIVFVKEYLYPNGKKGTNHFFVIIDKNTLAIPIEYFGMLVSSNLKKLKFKTNKLLLKDNKNNLHKDSIVKTDILYKISIKNILFKVGEVDINQIKIFKDNYLNNN